MQNQAASLWTTVQPITLSLAGLAARISPSHMLDSFHGGPDSVRTSLAEHLLGLCLMAMPADRPQILTRLCEENPREADELRQLYAMVEGMHLSEVLDAATLGAKPERLGDFRLIRRIGGGGMGVVYLAQQESLGRRVALKIIRPELLYFPRTKKRFLQEGKALASLSHPHIVPVYATGEVEDIPYIAMEWVEGRTLAEILQGLSDHSCDRLRGSHFFPCELSYESACLEIAEQVAKALGYAHSHGIVHRDIKPSNLIITNDGAVKLLDFGLAHSPESDRLTTCGSDEGSLAYMPPERLRGADKHADARSDLYSLGVTLYEMLSLSLPFRGKSREDTRNLILKGKVAPLRGCEVKVSWEAETICLTAMATEVEDRYTDAQALANDLQNARSRRPLLAKRPGTARRLYRWSQRNRLASAFLLFFLFSTVLTSAIALNAEKSRNRAEVDRRTAKAAASVLSRVLTLAATRTSSAKGGKQPLIQSLIWALDTIQDEYQENPEAEATIRLTIAKTLAPLGARERAYGEAEKSLAIQRRVFGNRSAEVVEGLRTMAWIAHLQGDLELAWSLSKNSMELAMDVHGRFHPKTLLRRSYYTKILLSTERYDLALKNAESVFRDCIEYLGKNELPTIIAARELSYALLRQHQPGRAVEIIREYHQIANSLLGPKDAQTLKLQRALARALEKTEKFISAERCFRGLLKLQREIHGPASSQATFAGNDLATYLDKRGQRDEARRLLQESMAVYRSRSLTLGGQKRPMARTSWYLARLELSDQRLEAAESWCRMSISYCTTKNRRLRERQLLLIEILLARGSTKAALDCAENQIARLEQSYTPEGRPVIDFRLDVVRLLRSSGRTSEAYRACRDCRAILDKMTGTPKEGLLAQNQEAMSLEKKLALDLQGN